MSYPKVFCLDTSSDDDTSDDDVDSGCTTIQQRRILRIDSFDDKPDQARNDSNDEFVSHDITAKHSDDDDSAPGRTEEGEKVQHPNDTDDESIASEMEGFIVSDDRAGGTVIADMIGKVYSAPIYDMKANETRVSYFVVCDVYNEKVLPSNLSAAASVTPKKRTKGKKKDTMPVRRSSRKVAQKAKKKIRKMTEVGQRKRKRAVDNGDDDPEKVEEKKGDDFCVDADHTDEEDEDGPSLSGGRVADVTWLYTIQDVLDLDKREDDDDDRQQLLCVEGDKDARIPYGPGALFESNHTDTLPADASDIKGWTLHDSKWMDAVYQLTAFGTDVRSEDNRYIAGIIDVVNGKVEFYYTKAFKTADDVLQTLLTRGAYESKKRWDPLLPLTWNASKISPRNKHRCTGCDSTHPIAYEMSICDHPCGASNVMYRLGLYCGKRLFLAQRLYRAFRVEHNIRKTNECVQEFYRILAEEEEDGDDV